MISPASTSSDAEDSACTPWNRLSISRMTRSGAVGGIGAFGFDLAQRAVQAAPPARRKAGGRGFGKCGSPTLRRQNADASISLALLASKKWSGLTMIGGIFSPLAYLYMMSNDAGPKRGLHSQVAPNLPSMIACTA